MRSHTAVIQRQTSPRVPALALVALAHRLPRMGAPAAASGSLTPADRRAGDSDTGPESNLNLPVSGWRRLGGAGGGEDALPGPSREPATISNFKYLKPSAVDAGAYVAAPSGHVCTAGSASWPSRYSCFKCPWGLLCRQRRHWGALVEAVGALLCQSVGRCLFPIASL